MAPGNRWVYRETDTTGAEEGVVVEVTDETKMVANGIEARVVRDTGTKKGVPIEITDDWLAQDAEGNVWYLGEHVTNYKNGKPVDHEGSFEAGVDGARAGIVMPAAPEPGMSCRQEYYAGGDEDEGAIIAVGEEQVEVPFGRFDEGVVMTRDLVPLEPECRSSSSTHRGRHPAQRPHRRRGRAQRARQVHRGRLKGGAPPGQPPASTLAIRRGSTPSARTSASPRALTIGTSISSASSQVAKAASPTSLRRPASP